MKLLQRLYPHLIAIFCFIFIAVVYFYPVLQGKKIIQSDIVQYTGMAKEQNDFRAAENQEPYWTNSAFGGMPTYQLGAKYPHDYIGKLDDAIRFLPRPADYLFLYFVGLYVLLLVIKIDPLKAFFGALAFGFSTYLIIILGVGHNAKAHAIGYMPLVVAGFVLVFRKKYIWGGMLSLFAIALEINANHFQMTYYLLLLLGILSAYFIGIFIKNKEYTTVYKTLGTLLFAAALAIATNATSLLATAEYADFSTRGKSELTSNPDGSKKTNSDALSREYITEYSYGIAESCNLIAPRLFGGSNSEALDKESEMYQFMLNQGVPEAQALDFIKTMPTYWGNQPIVAAPAYIGVVVFLLAIIALFSDKRKIKYVFAMGALASLVLSWGKNFSLLTDFCIDFVPLYNKFRAVSSIQVILEVCLPVLAIMGLQSFFKQETKQQLKTILQGVGTTAGFLILLFLCKGMFDFNGPSDTYFAESYGPNFVDALKRDRKTLYSADLLRSLFFVLSVAALLWFFIKNKLSQKTAIILIGIIMVSDLFFVAKKYVSAKDFVGKSEVETPFVATQADTEIAKDKGVYRVFEIDGTMSSARTSYFHKSIGGYSAVKPRRMQQLFDYHIAKNNLSVLNMLNVKYVIQTDSAGTAYPIINPDTNGNAWFINKLQLVNSANEELLLLKNTDTKKVALFNAKANKKLYAVTDNKTNLDTTGTIKLIKHQANYIQYASETKNKGIAVFSEIYYKNGWNAYIDGKKTIHFPVNYVLRALEIPIGKHEIEFKFEPQVVKTGSFIALVSSVVVMLLLIAAIISERKKKNRNLLKN